MTKNAPPATERAGEPPLPPLELLAVPVEAPPAAIAGRAALDGVVDHDRRVRGVVADRQTTAAAAAGDAEVGGTPIRCAPPKPLVPLLPAVFGMVTLSPSRPLPPLPLTTLFPDSVSPVSVTVQPLPVTYKPPPYALPPPPAYSSVLLLPLFPGPPCGYSW